MRKVAFRSAPETSRRQAFARRRPVRHARPVRIERLAVGVTVFEFAKIMGTSVRMIERHYGTLIDGAHAGITSRLDALESILVAELETRAEDGS